MADAFPEIFMFKNMSCLFTWITSWLDIIFLHHTGLHCATVFWYCIFPWRNRSPAWFFHPCRWIVFSIWMLEYFSPNPWSSMAKLGLNILSQIVLSANSYFFFISLNQHQTHLLVHLLGFLPAQLYIFTYTFFGKYLEKF